ncbi:type II toxin-antitoxin system HicA family toxin [Empedobacter brevis]
MGNNRPIKTSDWIKFLESHDCKYKSTDASHVKYRCPGCIRPIIHREKDKDIPPFHLKTNLKTMGLTLKYLYDWLDNNKK